jgi:hypothetical protein
LTSGSIAARGQTERVELSVDGYPRAFVIDVQCRPNGEHDNYSRGNFQASRLVSVTAEFPATVASPAPTEQKQLVGDSSRLVFKPCAQLRVEFAVDVRTNTFSGDYATSDGIYLLINDKPAAGPFYADRIVRTQMLSCDGSIVLSTLVTDYEQPIPATVLNETLTIRVKPPSIQPSHPAEVFLDNEPPRIDRDASQKVQRLFVGETLRATIVFADAGGLRSAMVGIDKAAPLNELDEADAPQTIDLSQLGLAGEKKVELATEGLPAREDPYSLIVRPTDLAGNIGEPTTFKFQVVLNTPASLKTNAIRAKVVDFSKKPISGEDWTLTISGPGTEETIEHGQVRADVSFVNGAFQISKLSPGKYKVKVVGEGNFGKVGDSKDVEAGPEKKPGTITLQATLDRYKEMFPPN